MLIFNSKSPPALLRVRTNNNSNLQGISMQQTHQLYQQAEIDSDPLTRQQKNRAQMRWQKDFQHLGRGNKAGDEAQALSHVAFLGYN